MAVSRYTSAYGSNTRTQVQEFYTRSPTNYSPDPSWSKVSGTVITNRAVRYQPVKGTRVNGFRMPTNWFMLAFNSTYRAFDYKASRPLIPGLLYYGDEAKGSGVNNQHAAPRSALRVINADSVPFCAVTVTANTQNRAYTEARAKLAQGDFNAGVALAESRRTIALIASSLIKATTAYRQARRGQWSKAGQTLGIAGWKDSRSLSDSWLKYHYGWIPLFADIYSASELLKDGFREKDQLFKVTREVREQLPIADVFPTLPREYSAKAEEVVKVVYWQKVSNSSLSAATALGLINPALIAWELVPFSFVVDWLIPVGNFLEAITGPLGLTFVAGYEDRIVRYTAEWTDWYGTYVSGTKPGGTAKYFAFQRVSKSAWDRPALYWKSPFSMQHAANALALLRSTSR